MNQIWDISSCSVVNEWCAQLLLLAPLGRQWMRWMWIFFFFWREHFSKTKLFQLVFLLHFFSSLLVRRLLVGVTSSTPAHTRGGGFGWWCNSNTQYIIHKHKHVPTLKSCYTIHICIHDTYDYKYKYMSTCTACIYVQCSIVHPFPRYILVTGVSQIPNAMQQRF